MKKICFVSSSGGHFEQLMMLRPLMDQYESFIITEKTKYEISSKEISTYYISQVNRKEISCVFKLINNLINSLKIFIKEKPDLIISTGALATIPICLIAKIFRKKLYLLNLLQR